MQLFPTTGEVLGAEVYVNNQYLGELPVTATLAEGRHTFRVVLGTGQEFSKTENVVFTGDGQAFTINFDAPAQ